MLVIAVLASATACINEQSLGNPGAAETAIETGTTSETDPAPSSSSGSVEPSPDGSGESSGGTGDCDGQATDGVCSTECELASGTQGCDFIVLGRPPSAPDEVQGVWITNPSPTSSVAVEFDVVPAGAVDRTATDLVVVPAGERVSWELSPELLPTAMTSRSSVGRRVHVISDRPIEVSFEAPLGEASTPEARPVLPLQRLKATYTVAGAGRELQLLAPDETTVVEWVPSVRTAGNGLPVSPVEPGGIGTMRLAPGELLHLFVDAPEGDSLRGTEISADHPLVCVGCE